MRSILHHCVANSLYFTLEISDERNVHHGEMVFSTLVASFALRMVDRLDEAFETDEMVVESLDDNHKEVHAYIVFRA